MKQCCRNIVAKANVSLFAALGNICCGSKNVSEKFCSVKFCFPGKCLFVCGRLEDARARDVTLFETVVTADSTHQEKCPVGGGGGGTLGISGWGCAVGTLEPLAYTRASFSWILLPYTRVNSPNHCYPRVAVFQKLRSLSQSKAKPKQNLIPQSLLS